MVQLSVQQMSATTSRLERMSKTQPDPSQGSKTGSEVPRGVLYSLSLEEFLPSPLINPSRFSAFSWTGLGYLETGASLPGAQDLLPGVLGPPAHFRHRVDCLEYQLLLASPPTHYQLLGTGTQGPSESSLGPNARCPV